MLKKLRLRLKREWTIFQSLPRDTRRFFGAALTYNLFDALVFTYTYAYLFSQTDSFIAVATYNTAFYITLLLGFFVTGTLLTIASSKTLFIVSSILQALSLFSVFFIPEVTMVLIVVAGSVCGLFQGIYWSVRNSVYMSFTNDDNRHYFEGLKSMLSSGSDMVLLALAGWFIATSDLFGILTKIQAYRLVGLLGVAILTVGTLFLSKATFPVLHITVLRIKKVSQHWGLFRIFIVVSAVQFALATSVPETLTLYFLGDEGMLGSLQAVFVILSALMIYILGRKTNKTHRFKLLLASALPLMLLSLSLLISQYSVLIVGYLLSMSLSNQLFWFTYFPVFSRAVEYEQTDESKQYPYILDHEIWINVSRIISTLVYVALVTHLGDVKGMFIALFLGALMQLTTALVARPLLKLQNKIKPNT